MEIKEGKQTNTADEKNAKMKYEEISSYKSS